MRNLSLLPRVAPKGTSTSVEVADVAEVALVCESVGFDQDCVTILRESSDKNLAILRPPCTWRLAT